MWALSFDGRSLAAAGGGQIDSVFEEVGLASRRFWQALLCCCHRFVGASVQRLASASSRAARHISTRLQNNIKEDTDYLQLQPLP